MEIAAAEALLRPTPDAILEAWRCIVESEKDQTESIPDRPRPEDFYGPIAERFRADPHRTDDPTLDALLELARPDETWIDVGAGAGRYAIPLALHVREVYAVEPSAGMRRELADAISEHGITNLQVFDERWPGPSTAPVADIGVICNVGHDIADIGPFIEALEAHASRLCVAMLFNRAPLNDYAPLWPHVHGIDRIQLPGMQELVALLFARGAEPEVHLVRLPGRVQPDLEAIRASARRPLWVLPGTHADERLAAAIEKVAVPVEGGYRIGPAERVQGVVTWRPRR